MYGKEIGFPGFTDAIWRIDKIAFKIKVFNTTIEVRWYGIIICAAIMTAFVYFLMRGKRTEKILEDDILNLALFTIPFAVIGARVFYVITHLSDYDGFMDAIAIWNGGIAIYGGLVFGLLTFIIYAKVKKLSVYKLTDAVAPGVMLGQAIGRWGNFVNTEAYGVSANVDKLPWRMTLNGVAYHPTFFYESLWNVIGFVIINIIYKNKKFDGQITLFYIMWYGLGRGFIEILRTDSCLVFGQKAFVYLGFVSFAVCLVLYILKHKKYEHSLDELAEYRAKFGSSDSTEKSEETTDDNKK